MSKFSGYSNRVNDVVMDWFGDHALFRPRNHAAFSISCVFDVREIQVFDESERQAVDTQEIWFWLKFADFARQKTPKPMDEIIYEKRSYEVARVMDEADGGVWVRVHENQKGMGSFNVI
jgi:hypothetical protein